MGWNDTFFIFFSRQSSVSYVAWLANKWQQLTHGNKLEINSLLPESTESGHTAPKKIVRFHTKMSREKMLQDWLKVKEEKKAADQLKSRPPWRPGGRATATRINRKWFYNDFFLPYNKTYVNENLNFKIFACVCGIQYAYNWKSKSLINHEKSPWPRSKFQSSKSSQISITCQNEKKK